MEHWILSLNPEAKYFEQAQKEWDRYGMLIRLASTMEQALSYASEDDYFLISIISENGAPQYLPYLPMLRDANAAPIYIISDTEADQEQAILLGADLYRASLDPESIKANVGAGWGLIRHNINVRKKRNVTTIQYKELFLCVEYRTVFANGLEIALTRTQFEMLRLLMSSPQRVFTYAQIHRRLWHENEVDNVKKAVFNSASKLRKKIKTVLQSQVYVSNIHDMGYRFSPCFFWRFLR